MDKLCHKLSSWGLGGLGSFDGQVGWVVSNGKVCMKHHHVPAYGNILVSSAGNPNVYDRQSQNWLMYRMRICVLVKWLFFSALEIWCAGDSLLTIMLSYKMGCFHDKCCTLLNHSQSPLGFKIIQCIPQNIHWYHQYFDWCGQVTIK